MFVQKTENGKKLFFRNSILTMMSKEEHQAMKTCFNKVHMRFHANQQWNQRRKEHLPCSFHMNTDFLRASLCKILISSFAHKMDFANNFSVDFF